MNAHGNRYEPGFHVFDRFGASQSEAWIAGPFPSFEAADADRRERNIAEDIVIFELIVAPDGTRRLR